jgi:SAM-dependent MidA family methyltransferase
MAREWMAAVAEKIAKGFAITIDYGYPAAERYAPWRNTGTLMCYHQHTTEENPLLRPGCQDITAHVDFTALEDVGAIKGLETLYFGEQYRFLMGLGFLEALIELQARESDPQRAQELRLTLKRLIMPESGMGDTFKVLVQGKGAGTPELSCMRRIADISLPQADFF